jgi:hypothetical protein
MKKVYLFALMSAMAVMAGFTACDKDPDSNTSGTATIFDGKITATNITGRNNDVSVPTELDSVVAVAQLLRTGTDIKDDYKVVRITSTTTYSQSAGFTLQFPSLLPDSLLEGTRAWMTAVPADVKMVQDIYILAYKDGAIVGGFRYCDKSADLDAIFWYVDKDVVLTMNDDEGKFNLTKGWNYVWFTESEEKGEYFSAVKPSNATPEWIYYDENPFK